MLPVVHKHSAWGLVSALTGPKTSFQQQEAAETAASLLGSANLKEEIVPCLLSKCGFAHKHTHTLWIQTAAPLIGTFSTKILPKPQLGSGGDKRKKTKNQKLSSSETLICERRQHGDTQACTEPESARGQQSCTRLDVGVLMASRVHGDVYSPFYCRHQAVPVPTSNIKLLCLT